MDFPPRVLYVSFMPDKTINEIPRDLRDLYQRGKAAFDRQNFDYAITFFQQVLQREPGFLECRQSLRVAQFKKSGGNTGFFKKIVGGASVQPLIAKAQMAKGKNPAEAMAIAEQILDGDPGNNTAHKIIAEAALQVGLPKTACFAYELLLKNNPKDYDLSMAYGAALAQAGLGEKAEQIYSELERAHPHKAEISTALKNLSAHKTIDSGYGALADGTGSYRDVLRNKDEAVSLEQQSRVVRSDDRTADLITEYEAQVAREPGNLKRLRDLAELYKQRKDFDKAISYYEQIRATDAGSADSSLEKAINETTLRRYDHQISQLYATNPEQAAALAQLQQEKTAFQLEDARKRSERYPTDLIIKFELGQLYFQAGKFTEAMAEFQKAQNNPQKRLQAMSYLGQCLAAKGMNDMAARRIQDALKEKPTFDDEKKELLYILGSVLEKMGKKEEALEQYKQIFEVDMGYKDVLAKVEASYSGQG